jgi:hypothetical protein
MQKPLKESLLRIWPLRLVMLLVLRPKRFMDEFVNPFIDYRRFRRTALSFLQFVARGLPPARADVPALLIVAGEKMEAQWTQLWSVLAAVHRRKGQPVYALTSKSQPLQNLYFRLFGIPRLYLEDMRIHSVPVPESYAAAVRALQSFAQFKDFEAHGVPFGQIAISTYGRLHATGIVDVTDPTVKAGVQAWILYIYRTFEAARKCYADHNIGMLYFTEVFMLEYGALYYAALSRELNVIRFATTARDDAVIVQHLTNASDRTHHASVTEQSWARICGYPDSPQVDRELQQNFLDRYGERWALSSRNQPNTRIMPVSEAKALLGVTDSRRIGVVFSHILYDTMFFFGEDLFPCYADWFVATVKAACANPKILWFVKVHPSNLWRGELQHYFGGKYEEVRLIEKHVGELPEHVRLVYPDTPISPYTWFQLADYGITVRGTSGIELGALGKTVLTAGSGRYEKIGFTVNPGAASEYLDILARLPDIPPLTAEQRRLAARFAYATFCMKPFTLDFLKPVARAGKARIFSTYDLVYLGNFGAMPERIPDSIERFVSWSFDKDRIDLLNDWPEAPLEAAESARRFA